MSSETEAINFTWRSTPELLSEIEAHREKLSRELGAPLSRQQALTIVVKAGLKALGYDSEANDSAAERAAV